MKSWSLSEPQKKKTEEQNWIQSARQLRKHLLKDLHRPRYHLVTPEGICEPFDPNAALFWKGRYHLMYILQTEKGHSYAHISSRDLVHWHHHGIPLEPGDGDQMIFSGGAFVDKDGIPTLSYWGVGRGICIATSKDDDLERWDKSPHNPVIRETEKGLAVVRKEGTDVVYGAADPSAVWMRDGLYYMLTGNLLVLREYGLKRKISKHLGDTAYLFSSHDMEQWEYLHPFYESKRMWTQKDEDNMCPDFFPLPSSPDGGPPSDRHLMLFISHNRGCQYYVGRYEEDRFHPEVHGRMSWVDKAFFAPETLIDDRGRRIMWAWIHDGRRQETRKVSGWSGTLSLPRILWLGKDGTLRMAPAPELALLRYNHRRREDLFVPADEELSLTEVSGNTIELRVELKGSGVHQFGLKVARSPGGIEETLVLYDFTGEQLKIDTTKSSLGEGPKSIESAPLKLDDGESLKLRIFLDRSVVEVFANDRQAVMRRIYPTSADAREVILFSRGASSRVSLLEAWDMAPSNPW